MCRKASLTIVMAEEQELIVDIDKIIRDKAGSKSRYVPRFAVNWLKRLLHQDRVNRFLSEHKDEKGVAWLKSCVEYLEMNITVVGRENLPANDGKRYTFVSNHPLGGQDGVALGALIGAHFDGDGVGDNGSGTALLLATATGLQGKKPHYTTKYVFFDGEEEGMLGSSMNVMEMSDDEVKNTIYMINMDAIAFGDYANIYGGLNTGYDRYLMDENSDKIPPMTDAYYFAAKISKELGFEVMGPDELDGYFAEHETGPEINDKTFYTNPWTAKNPAPLNDWGYSPATIPASDHVPYMMSGIQYIYFEATNWFASSSKSDTLSYTGYLETYDETLGEDGMFMNTKYDTLENLNELFPGRAEAHMHLYSPLLSALILAE